ncbi:MAG: hypothetical protein R3B45_04870 [Bdellovibrionota bacterium]
MGTSGLGQFLIKEGILSKDDCATIVRETGHASASFVKGIIALGLFSEDQLAQYIAARTHFPVIPRERLIGGTAQTVGILDLPLLKKLEVLPYEQSGDSLVVAMADPLDYETIEQLEFFLDFKIKPAITTLTAIHGILKTLAKDFSPESTPLQNLLSKQIKRSVSGASAVAESHSGGGGASHRSVVEDDLLDDLPATDESYEESGIESGVEDEFAIEGSNSEADLDSMATVSDDVEVFGDTSLPGQQVKMEVGESAADDELSMDEEASSSQLETSEDQGGGADDSSVYFDDNFNFDDEEENAVADKPAASNDTLYDDNYISKEDVADKLAVEKAAPTQDSSDTQQSGPVGDMGSGELLFFDDDTSNEAPTTLNATSQPSAIDNKESLPVDAVQDVATKNEENFELNAGDSAIFEDELQEPNQEVSTSQKTEKADVNLNAGEIALFDDNESDEVPAAQAQPVKSDLSSGDIAFFEDEPSIEVIDKENSDITANANKPQLNVTDVAPEQSESDLGAGDVTLFGDIPVGENNLSNEEIETSKQELVNLTAGDATLFDDSEAEAAFDGIKESEAKVEVKNQESLAAGGVALFGDSNEVTISLKEASQNALSQSETGMLAGDAALFDGLDVDDSIIESEGKPSSEKKLEKNASEEGLGAGDIALFDSLNDADPSMEKAAEKEEVVSKNNVAKSSGMMAGDSTLFDDLDMDETSTDTLEPISTVDLQESDLSESNTGLAAGDISLFEGIEATEESQIEELERDITEGNLTEATGLLAGDATLFDDIDDGSIQQQIVEDEVDNDDDTSNQDFTQKVDKSKEGTDSEPASMHAGDAALFESEADAESKADISTSKVSFHVATLNQTITKMSLISDYEKKEKLVVEALAKIGLVQGYIFRSEGGNIFPQLAWKSQEGKFSVESFQAELSNEVRDELCNLNENEWVELNTTPKVFMQTLSEGYKVFGGNFSFSNTMRLYVISTWPNEFSSVDILKKLVSGILRALSKG